MQDCCPRQEIHPCLLGPLDPRHALTPNGQHLHLIIGRMLSGNETPANAQECQRITTLVPWFPAHATVRHNSYVFQASLWEQAQITLCRTLLEVISLLFLISHPCLISYPCLVSVPTDTFPSWSSFTTTCISLSWIMLLKTQHKRVEKEGDYNDESSHAQDYIVNKY